MNNGVVLAKITLYSGNVSVDTRFVVKSHRTPEVSNFGGITEAEEYFNEEVQRLAYVNGVAANAMLGR